MSERIPEKAGVMPVFQFEVLNPVPVGQDRIWVQAPNAQLAEGLLYLMWPQAAVTPPQLMPDFYKTCGHAGGVDLIWSAARFTQWTPPETPGLREARGKSKTIEFRRKR